MYFKLCKSPILIFGLPRSDTKLFKEMLNFNDSIENVGEAKGLKSIKNNNFNKFRNHLTKNQIKKIELLTFPIIKSLNYTLDNKINYHKDLNKIEQFLFYGFISHCIYYLKACYI